MLIDKIFEWIRALPSAGSIWRGRGVFTGCFSSEISWIWIWFSFRHRGCRRCCCRCRARVNTHSYFVFEEETAWKIGRTLKGLRSWTDSPPSVHSFFSPQLSSWNTAGEWTNPCKRRAAPSYLTQYTRTCLNVNQLSGKVSVYFKVHSPEVSATYT